MKRKEPSTNMYDRQRVLVSATALWSPVNLHGVVAT